MKIRTLDDSEASDSCSTLRNPAVGIIFGSKERDPKFFDDTIWGYRKFEKLLVREL